MNKPGSVLPYFRGLSHLRTDPHLLFPFWEAQPEHGPLPPPSQWIYGFIDLGRGKYAFGEIYGAEKYTTEGVLRIPDTLKPVTFWRSLLEFLTSIPSGSQSLPSQPDFSISPVCAWKSPSCIQLSVKSRSNRAKTVGWLNPDILEKDFIEDVIHQIALVLKEYERRIELQRSEEGRKNYLRSLWQNFYMDATDRIRLEHQNHQSRRSIPREFFPEEFKTKRTRKTRFRLSNRLKNYLMRNLEWHQSIQDTIETGIDENQFRQQHTEILDAIEGSFIPSFFSYSAL